MNTKLLFIKNNKSNIKKIAFSFGLALLSIRLLELFIKVGPMLEVQTKINHYLKMLDTYYGEEGSLCLVVDPSHSSFVQRWWCWFPGV